MTTRQLQIRALNLRGELGPPTKYPVGCSYTLVGTTRVNIFHPDGRNPAWEGAEDDDDEVPKYLCSYATFVCPHGLLVEYVAVEGD